MGKGDIKTRRGKIANKSYGARRLKKVKKPLMARKKSAKTAVKKTTKKE